MNSLLERADAYWFGSVSARPLAAFRIAFAAALAAYFVHHAMAPTEWLGDSPLKMPPLEVGNSSAYRYLQPVYAAPMSMPLVGLMIMGFALLAAGLALGRRARLCAALLCIWITIVTLSDWIASFSINRSAVIVLAAMACMPLGASSPLRRAAPGAEHVTIPAWSIRTLQWFLVTWYFASGIDKLRGGWLVDPSVLWTQLQGWYQTPAAWWVLQNVPRAWVSGGQYLALIFEVGAPLLLIPRRSRPVGIVLGVVMHVVVAILMARLWMFSLYMLAFYPLFFVPESPQRR